MAAEQTLSDAMRATGGDTDERSAKALLEDKSGAVLLMGLFMAVFLVGMIYYLVGLTDNILHREFMQDASDTGAFAAAVTNARGMNLIVLLNLIMAIVVAIVIMLRMVQMIITAALAIAAVVGFFCGGCTAPAVAWLKSAESAVRNIANRVEDIAQEIVRVSHSGQEIIARAWPVIGQARSFQAVNEGPFNPPATAGVAFPIYATLPVEDHVFQETCDRGKPFATELVGEPFELIPVIGGKVSDFISGAAGRLYDFFSRIYCGGGDPGDPPCFDQEKPYPEYGNTKACVDQCQGESAGYGPCAPCADGFGTAACDDALTQICHDSVQENNISGARYCSPRDINADGDCTGEEITFLGCSDPRRDDTEVQTTPRGSTYERRPSQGACLTRTRNALSQCDSGDVEQWQYATETRFLVWWADKTPTSCTIRSQAIDPMSTAAELIRPERREYEVRDMDRPPSGCLAGGLGIPGSGRTYPDGSPMFPWDAVCPYGTPTNWGTAPPAVGGQPPGSPLYNSVCNTQLPESLESAINDINSASAPDREVSWYPVPLTSEIYGCLKNDQVCVDPDSVTRPDTSSWEPPMQVCRWARGSTLVSTACPDREGDDGELLLGDQDFQMRTVVFGDEPPGIGRRGVRIAAWGEDESNAVADAANAVARLSIAQAEFYWDQDEDWRDNDYEHSLNRGKIEWMWDMAWRGRLRRVSFTNGGAARDSCDSSGTDCSGFDNFLGTVTSGLDNFFLH